MNPRHPCRLCGAPITRHQRKSHEKSYCSAKGAPGLQPKPCANPARVCPTIFTPDARHPQQIYCSLSCAREADALRRARAQDAGAAPAELQDAKDNAQMAAFRRREECLRAEVERTDALMLSAQQRRHELMLELLGVRP